MESGESSGSLFSGVPTHTSVKVTCETTYMMVQTLPSDSSRGGEGGGECAGEAGIHIPIMSRPLSSAEENPQGGCKSGKQNVRANGFKAKTRACASEENNLLLLLDLHLTLCPPDTLNMPTGMMEPQKEAVL